MPLVWEVSVGFCTLESSAKGDYKGKVLLDIGNMGLPSTCMEVAILVSSFGVGIQDLLFRLFGSTIGCVHWL